MEPAWKQVRENWQGQLQWRYCMGGLLKDWSSYRDPVQAVSRPVQMGPLWMEAKYTSGQPFNEKIWLSDPPASSYPACLAVKAAELQGRGEEMLYTLREAVMANGRNIARREIILELAGGAGLDVALFSKDLSGDLALQALREDLNEAASKGIQRFPTVIIARSGRPGLLFTGYRPADVWQTMLEEYLHEWKPVA